MTSSHPAVLPLLLGTLTAAVAAFALVGYGFPAIDRSPWRAVAPRSPKPH